MDFLIITHVPHIYVQDEFLAYAPYIREMNIWAKYTTKITIVAPLKKDKKTPIHLAYQNANIDFVTIDSFDILSFKSFFTTIFKVPKIAWKIYKAIKTADHIHLRCPGNIGLIGCFIQILFPNKPKTAKYAGNWDASSKQPFTYKLQRLILSNTFLTKNIKVLVYGKWKNQSKNVLPFFTASYLESEKEPVIHLDLKRQIKMLFVGALAEGKRPLYAIQLVEKLYKSGCQVSLSLFGDGIERSFLEKYIINHNLSSYIFMEGNQNNETLKKAYKESHFVILPSQSEGWPKVIAEGMFWGCVPLATAVSCVPYMVDYGNRGIILSLDLEKDVESMLNLIKNEDLYQQMVSLGIEWSRNFTLDKFEKEISLLLKP